MSKAQPPTREDISTRWQSVARGDLSRESVSQWAEPLMFAEYEIVPDILAMQGLQYLHGFDMTYRSENQRLVGHGPPGEYVRTLDEVAEELVAWEERCVAYDKDPAGWLAARRAEAIAYIEAERHRQ